MSELTTAELLNSLPRPYPAGGQENYQNILNQRFEISPLCEQNYKRYKQATSNDKNINVINYDPIRLDVENCSRCNFACSMCQVSKWENGIRARDMTLPEFKEIIDSIPSLTEVKIQGFGEPLLAGDNFHAMVGYARSKKIWVRTTINGSLLHINDNIRKLIESDINEISISIDGGNKKTFETIRKKSNFDLVKKNCTLLAQKLSEDKKEYLLKFNTTLQIGNYDDRYEIIDLIAGIGGKSLNYTFSISEFGDKLWHQENDSKKVNEELSYSECLNLLDYAKARGVELTFWAGLNKYSQEDNNICPWPFSRLYISSDNRVVPCCIIGNPDIYEFENNDDVSISEKIKQVWNSNELKEFREAHLHGEIPDVCKFCYTK